VSATTATLLATTPDVTPTDLQPIEEHEGTTVRWSVDEAFRLHLQAVLTHPAETVVRRPLFVKEYAL